ncbi:MAG: hypothetical protein ACFHXK_18915 [bacterium]
MTRKLAFIAFIALAMTHLFINEAPLQQDRVAHQSQPPRQFIDAKPTAPAPVADSTPRPERIQTGTQGVPMQAHAQDDLRAGFDADIPWLSSALDLHRVNTLMRLGEVTINLPDGSQSTLRTLHTRSEFGMTHLQAQADGYVATITRRGDDFFATLANATGSYRIEGNAEQSRIFPHQLIAQRRIAHENDYRHVHSNP